MTDQIPPSSSPPPPQVNQDEKLIAALGYIGPFIPFFIVPLIIKPKSPYCKFHAQQSMVLFLMGIVVLVVLGTIRSIGSLLTLAIFAVHILAIYRAYQGDLWQIPFVSNFASKIDVDTLYGKAGIALSGISGLKEKAEGFAEKTGEAVKNLGKQEEDKVEPPSAPTQPLPQAPTKPPSA